MIVFSLWRWDLSLSCVQVREWCEARSRDGSKQSGEESPREDRPHWEQLGARGPGLPASERRELLRLRAAALLSERRRAPGLVSVQRLHPAGRSGPLGPGAELSGHSALRGGRQERGAGPRHHGERQVPGGHLGPERQDDHHGPDGGTLPLGGADPGGSPAAQEDLLRLQAAHLVPQEHGQVIHSYC